MTDRTFRIVAPIVVLLIGWLFTREIVWQARHRCTQTHVEHVGEYTAMIPVDIQNSLYTWITYPAHDDVVCDQWEPKP